MSKAQGEKGKGLKANSNKILMGLLPAPALYEVARVLTYGANKYTICDDCKATFQHGRTECSECGSSNIVSGAHNWSKGMNWSWIIDALERHLDKFKCGIDIDKESGLLHASQIACNALFLLTFQVMNIGKDDRWKPTKEQLEHMNSLHKWIEQVMEQVQNDVPVSLSLDEEFNANESIDLEINDSTKELLFDLAKQEDKTVNAVIVDSLKDMIKKHEEKELQSDPTDNSTNNEASGCDKYMDRSELNTPW